MEEQNADTDAEFNASSDEEQDRCQRRQAIHFSSIDDFLSSLNTDDTKLESVKGDKLLNLDKYQHCMNGRETAADDGSNAAMAEPKAKQEQPQIEVPALGNGDQAVVAKNKQTGEDSESKHIG